MACCLLFDNERRPACKGEHSRAVNSPDWRRDNPVFIHYLVYEASLVTYIQSRTVPSGHQPNSEITILLSPFTLKQARRRTNPGMRHPGRILCPQPISSGRLKQFQFVVQGDKRRELVSGDDAKRAEIVLRAKSRGNTALAHWRKRLPDGRKCCSTSIPDPAK